MKSCIIKSGILFLLLLPIAKEANAGTFPEACWTLLTSFAPSQWLARRPSPLTPSISAAAKPLPSEIVDRFGVREPLESLPQVNPLLMPTATEARQLWDRLPPGLIEVFLIPEKNGGLGHLAVRIGETVYNFSAGHDFKNGTQGILIKHLSPEEFLERYSHYLVMGALVQVTDAQRLALEESYEQTLKENPTYIYDLATSNCASNPCRLMRKVGIGIAQESDPFFAFYSINRKSLVAHTYYNQPFHEVRLTLYSQVRSLTRNPLITPLRAPRLVSRFLIDRYRTEGTFSAVRDAMIAAGFIYFFGGPFLQVTTQSVKAFLPKAGAHSTQVPLEQPVP